MRLVWLRLPSLFLAIGLTACKSQGGLPAPDLAAALDELRASPALQGGRVGVHVVDIDSGEALLEHAAGSGFATASNLKLISAATALLTLGPEFRFTTELHRRGRIDGGVLHGDLLLVGGGDPALGRGGGVAAFDPLVAALRESGVQRVRGRVIGDDSFLGPEHLGLGWQWDYLDEAYAAPFGGLCFGDNLARYRIEATADGVRVQALPPASAPTVTEVRSGPPGSEAELVATRALGGDLVTIRGVMPAAAKAQVVTVTVSDAAAHAASALRAALQTAGIGVDGIELPAAEPSQPVARLSSPPLRDLLVPLLRDSDNLYAEQALRVAARIATGNGGTAAAERHAKAVLAGLGIDVAGMVLADGSGLSRRNLVQPRQLTALLAAMHRHPDGVVFTAALPLAGRSGTLGNRMITGPAAGRVRAKTGFISRVVCLSGCVPRADANAKPWAFSVMLNDFTTADTEAKAAVDRFVQQLAAAAQR